ncbi:MULTISPECIES: hypothetical protein [unclassified Vibrio]|uniref:hypothetical protein n=1 Tax=unclassified Vibrio TaxID=2614977 RepID=UPI0013613282|nr:MULTISPECIES: hypothetical protein [unclassified Vibrio]NAW57765.1 hypothetical protein [Vibrio sp. V36_P2S2PM302]NAX28418.1 hypothetical protein [Vibrio sp. V38_P2S17PM301]NAX29578.1 hypothetical protein [Vibrio sp. V37_P2S8PM304]
MLQDFFQDDFTFKNIANTWLTYEQIRHGSDATPQGQEQVYNKPTTNSQVNEVQEPQVSGGLSTELKIGLGAVGLVALILLIKK